MRVSRAHRLSCPRGTRGNYAGVRSGVTTILDAGSVGVANAGALFRHILPRSQTRVLYFLNDGSYAHTMPSLPGVTPFEDIDRNAIASCVDAHPRLVSGLKPRLVGPLVESNSEELVDISKAIAGEHNLPFMVHVGSPQGDRDRLRDLALHPLRSLESGDIISHICTPLPKGVMDSGGQVLPELLEARSAGVVLEAAMGRGNFRFEVARSKAEEGIFPDTFGTDLTAARLVSTVFSLVECVANFVALGVSLHEVIERTTAGSARAIGKPSETGSLRPGYRADTTVLREVEVPWENRDSEEVVLRADRGLEPVLTVKDGRPYEPLLIERP